MEIGRRNQEKKKNQQYESKKANKVNDDLKLNIDEQQDDIKYLKEHLKEKALCVTSNPSIATTKKWMKKRIQEIKKSSCEFFVAKC